MFGRHKRLFSKQNLYELDDRWWVAVNNASWALSGAGDRMSLEDKIAVCDIVTEFADAIDWLRTL